jgi:hypothetical protein
MTFNSLQKGVMWLFNINPSREVMHNIDEEQIKESKQYKNLAKKVVTLESQLAHNTVENLQKKESDGKKELEEKIAIDLINQEKELTADEFGRVFSMKQLWWKYFKDKKFRDKFEVADKNDEVSWKFGDWLVSSKGMMIITDINGVPRAISPSIAGLIHNPASIFNQVEKRARLLLARDKNFEYIPGLDDEGYVDEFETTVPIWNEEENKYNESRELTRKARELIIEKDTESRDKSKKIESLEIVVNSLRENNEDLKRANNILLHSNNQNKSAVTEANNTIQSLSLSMTDIQRKISTLTESNVLLEKELMVRDTIIDKLLKKLEETGDMTAFMKAKAIIEESREFDRANAPETENKQVPAQVPQTQG